MPKYGIMLVWLSNSVAIKNGNNAGSTEFAHKEIPDFAATKLSLENIIKANVNEQNVSGKMSFFIDIIIKLFFSINYKSLLNIVLDRTLNMR
ncbi:MAG: hypothetical protein FWF46_04855 [Oscillospiraceae bacterium]|nr:hypothetical protein [Oscillospiraceae bacterium]